MKKVKMSRDFDYRPTSQRLTAFRAGRTYPRVPEAAAEAIVAAGAGEIVEQREARTSETSEGRRGRRA